MEQALGINELLAGLIGSAIGWGGFIVVLIIIGRWVMVALSRAAFGVIRSADEETQRLIIKHLVNQRLTLRELYAEMKAEESEAVEAGQEEN